MGDDRSEDLGRLREHVYKMALGLVRDPALAEDIVQETFTARERALVKGGVQRNLEAWLVTVAYRKSIDALRRRKVERKRLSAVDADAIPTPVLDSSLYAHITSEHLEQALTQLPSNQERVIRMWAHDAKLREIAADQSTSIATAHRNVGRALLALRKALRELVPEQEDDR